MPLAMIAAWCLAQSVAEFDDPSREIQWARSFEEAYAEAEARRVPVLVWLTSDTCPPCMKIERGPFKAPSYAAALNDACVPVAFTESYNGWPEVELKDGGRVVKRCKDFPRLTVEQMKEIFSSRQAPKRIDELGKWATPAYLVVDWNGKVLFEHLDKGSVTADGILRDVREAGKQFGAGAGCADYRAYEKGRREVEAALESGDLSLAVRKWLELARLKTLTRRMKEEVDLLNERVVCAGEARMEETQDRDALRRLAECFVGHPFEKEIRKRLK